MTKKYLFTSDRLGFRPWESDDLKPYARLNADPQVMEFFPRTYSANESARQIERFQRMTEIHGYAPYAVDRLDTQALIGFIGFMHTDFPASFTPCTEIGWRLAREAWGQGYATEGAMACLQYGWKTLELEEIYSFTAVVNQRSERVMQKIGMEAKGHFEHPKIEEGSVLRPHVLYQITKPLPCV